MKRFWQIRAAEDPKVGEVLLYGYIASESWWGDEVTPKQFKADLDALGDIDELRVFINSGGGDVFASQAIYSMLKRHKARVTVFIDGLAASGASLVAMAGDTVKMPANALMMVHHAAALCWGTKEDMLAMAEALEKIGEAMIVVYADKTGLAAGEINDLLAAETWMTAAEAVELGFADEIEEAKQVAASLRDGRLVVNGQEMDLSRFRNAPRLAFIPAAQDARVQAPAAPPDQRPVPLDVYERYLGIHESRRYES